MSEEHPVCPRCGGVGGYIWSRKINNRRYYYWVHESRRGRERKVKYCYLGPAEYIHASIFNPIGLAGAVDKNCFQRYARELLSHLTDEQKLWLYELLVDELKMDKEIATPPQQRGGSR